MREAPPDRLNYRRTDYRDILAAAHCFQDKERKDDLSDSQPAELQNGHKQEGAIVRPEEVLHECYPGDHLHSQRVQQGTGEPNGLHQDVEETVGRDQPQAILVLSKDFGVLGRCLREITSRCQRVGEFDPQASAWNSQNIYQLRDWREAE